MVALSGGDKLEAYLADLGSKLEKSAVLDVGFFENATYPDGTPVAMVAAVQNFGAPSRGIPPRPFFTRMIDDHKDEWGPQLGERLMARDMDPQAALADMGIILEGELQQAIIDLTDPPLKPATIKRKGFEKPLVASGHMLNSVASKVTT